MNLGCGFLCLLVLPNMAVSFVVPVTRHHYYSSFAVAASNNNDNDNDNNNDIMDLYKTVADQDPEWYQEFVTNILQEDVLEDFKSTEFEPDKNNDNNVVKNNNGAFNTESRQNNVRREADIQNDILAVTDSQEPEEVLHEMKSDDVPQDDTTVKATIMEKEVTLENDPLESPDNQSDDKDIEEDKVDDILSKQEIDVMVENTVQAALEVETKSEPPTDNQETLPEDLSRDADQPKPTIIVYRDLYTGTLLAAPLRALTRLGYTDEEVSYLQPDALSLILEDEIAKPRRGIPLQWKMSPSQKKVLQDDVRIVTKDEAREIIQASSKNRKQKRMPPVIEDDVVNNAPRRRGRRPEQQQQQQVEARTRPERPRPPRQPAETPMNPKGRGDPPAPINPVWVDIDTFRELLRREAELRIRILGGDWKDTVKKESKWRLDLYKEWLWSLHDGVEDTRLVESRVPLEYREPVSRRRQRPPPTEGSPPPRRRRRRQASARRDDSERTIMDPRRRRSSQRRQPNSKDDLDSWS